MEQGALERKLNLREHEKETIAFLRGQGFRVQPVKPSLRPNVKTADLLIQELAWEIKRPQVCNKRTLEHAYKAALKQAVNVIFDLRSLPIKDDWRQVQMIRRLFADLTKARRLMIITKDGKLQRYAK